MENKLIWNVAQYIEKATLIYKYHLENISPHSFDEGIIK